MNKNSLICKYIESHSNTWEQDFEKLNIRVTKSGNYALFKYFMNADFFNPLICEARGIIIDVDSLDVVCIAFNKFFNLHEPYAADIDWDNCKVQDKKDGAICKLWFDRHKNNWVWSTNGVIYAEDANIEDFKHKNYYDLILDAINYKYIDFNKLNKDNTYIFEIVDPIMHPVKYPKVKLYHIGTRNNITLEECNENIGIEKPEEYDLHSLPEVIKFVENMNQDEVDKDWNRIKIKNLTYLQLHYLHSGIITNKAKILELLHTDDINIKDLIKRFPQYEEVFNYYIEQERQLQYNLQLYINHTRETYANLGRDRKKIAEVIKNDEWKYFGFKSLDSLNNAEMMLQEIRIKNISSYAKLIKDYE